MMSRKTVKVIVIIIVIAMVATSFSFVFFLPSAFGAEITPREQQFLTEQLKELERYMKFLHENFKDEVDFTTLVNGAFEGAMRSLDDPYSVFFVDPRDGQTYVETATGEYEGIGVTLTINADGYCEIVSIFLRSPAHQAGMRPGDLIFKIDSQDVTEKPLSEIVAMLRGKAGTTVTVAVKRAGVDRSFTVTRAKVSPTSVEYEMLEGDIGYILLKSFAANGAREFREARAELIRSGAKSLIIDVRDNAGGIVGTAVGIADQFLSTGDIMHLKQRGEIIETLSATSSVVGRSETVVLVNEYSASSAEILAGALQDNKAATLVGTTTYGKGAAQLVAYTNERNPYRLSIYYFLTPNKNDIHGVGITPDHVVRNSLGDRREEALKSYEAFAPFVENAKPTAGETGLNVFAAQQRLALLGYSVKTTAVMDAATVEAIKSFQREQGLHPYGVLDFTTMRKIRDVTHAYVNNDAKEDLQLKKAIELLSK